MISQEQFKTKPYKHQIKALDLGWDKPSFALFMEMGTGKSKVLLDNITLLARAKKINFAFIIAPKGVYRNWISKEIPEHFSEDISYECIFWKSSMNQGEKKYWVNFWKNPPQDKFIIFVMNVEAFSTARAFKNADVISSMFAAKGLIALDESTTIKNPKAKRTKALLKISNKFPYKRILTGSPVTNSPLDLFSQCEFLGRNMLGFNSYYAFRARYAVLNSRQMGNHSFQQVVGYRHMDELTRKIDKFSFRVLKDECLDLPKKIYTSRYVYMTSEQLKMYEDIRKKAVLMLDNDEFVSTPMMITQMLRLQQILSGHLKSDDGNLITFPTRRLDELLEICDEAPNKVIIWSRFRYDIMSIVKALNSKYKGNVAKAFFGDTSDNERQEIVRDFQDMNSELRFMVGNPSTAGRGLTLTAANTVIYYANDFNLETRMQSEDRCHRIGQDDRVTYIDLICEGTIDEKIVKSLTGKIKLSAEVLGENIKEWLKISKK